MIMRHVLRHARIQLTFVSLGVFALLGGCATTPPVTVKSDILDSAAARSRSVAVMSDFYMENPSEADHVAAQVRQELKDQGFKVSSSELDADLIVVPTLARSERPVAPAHVAPRVSLLAPSSFGQPGMMQGSRDMSGIDTPSEYQIPKVGLMISAVTKENWLQTATAGANVPRVWRVTAVTEASRNSSKDLAPALLRAAGPDLAKISSLASQPAPQPTPAP